RTVLRGAAAWPPPIDRYSRGSWRGSVAENAGGLYCAGRRSFATPHLERERPAHGARALAPAGAQCGLDGAHRVAAAIREAALARRPCPHIAEHPVRRPLGRHLEGGSFTDDKRQTHGTEAGVKK